MKLLVKLTCAAALALSPAALHAGPIAGGDLVVYRVGTGSGSLVNTGNPVFVDEFTTTGSPVQSIGLNSTGGGIKLISSGTASSEGMLTVSPGGQYLALTGYNAAPGGSTNLANATSATINRTVAIIPVTSGTAGYTALSDLASANNVRSAVTTDGTSIWATGGAGGVRYTTAGSSTSTLINSGITNFRQVNVFDGQLYASTTATTGGNTAPLGAVGTGTPQTSGQSFNGLPGLPTTANPTPSSENAYFFADLDGNPGVDTLYVTDDGAADGGLTKFSLISGTWVSNGTIGIGSDNYRGVTGYVSGGTVHLFAVRKGGGGATGGGELVAIDDASGFNGAFAGAPTLLATAATNEAFRGVAYIPVAVPEPATGLMLVIGAAGVGLLLARRPRD